MSSGDFEFETILAVALGHDTKDLSETQKTIIKDRLDRKIQQCRIAILTVRLDTSGMQTPQQHDSLDQSVFYVMLENDCITRFSMENSAISKKGTESPGELIMKFQDFKNIKNISWKEITGLSLQRPWVSEVLLTLRHLVIFANIATVNRFTMAKDLDGCHTWV
ncbi:hypothetical protein NEOLI_005343 [Neolecta irregularis DAH-3]|uniref:Uncharacterized protein n=1 Tax=Neolecta irregularis (strain DAH-3) TaxID=1198029 RepID=A0A1U7LWI9_NEOID|nr:hypothetical protein NEOLI_005343 [Neolecta irregularis DAH-3]|eukprot:OLL26912.1 hypothetical protein NEOLI_005343 [Neolecta irregularis DAH-3]